MKNKFNARIFKPIGCTSIFFLSLGLMMLSFSLFIFLNPIKIDLFFYGFLFGILGFIFTFNVFGQKIVVQNNKMYVYLWGKNRWTFDLASLHQAEMGFYYRNKIDAILYDSRYHRKHFSIQVMTEEEKTCFPVDLYSTKQQRTIVFILNNSTYNKFNDCRLQGQEKYLINARLVMAMYSQKSGKHDHCEFCRTKFGYSGGLERGYATKDRYLWICEKCFEDFKDMFNFKVIQNKK